MPAASLMVDALRQHASDRSMQVHIVGHSAGAIFSAHLLDRLIEEGFTVSSVSWLAPAIRVDDFERLVLPRLQNGALQRFTSFGLQDVVELNDHVGSDTQRYYQKSLLYLISRALESRGQGEVEVPLLGLQRHSGGPLGDTSVREEIESVGGELIWAPSEGDGTGRSGATSHAVFDEDSQTMTSVMLRILGGTEPHARETFRAYAPLGAPANQMHRYVQPVNTESVGDEPLRTMGGPQSAEDSRPTPGSDGRAWPARGPQEASSSVVDALRRRGWLPVDDATM